MGAARSARNPLAAALALVACLAASAFAAPEPPLRLTASVATARVRCGDPVTVRVELRNPGPLRAQVYLKGLALETPDGALLPLTPVEGHAQVVKQQGLEPWLVKADAPRTGEHSYVRIQPGESALFEATDPAVSAIDLGLLSRTYRIRGDDPDLESLAAPADARVSVDVTPSELMLAAWKARTPEQAGEALPEFLKLLQAGGTPQGELLLHTTLRYLASSGLALLDAALQQADPQVRASAIDFYGYAVWSVGNMAALRLEYGRRGYRPAWLRQVPRGDAEKAQRRPAGAGAEGAARR